MSNPFEIIENQLEKIEHLIKELNNQFLHQKDQTSSKSILNIKEASELINLTTSTIYSKVGKREIPFMKKGKKLYFSKDDLITFIESGKKETLLEGFNKSSIINKHNRG